MASLEWGYELNHDFSATICSSVFHFVLVKQILAKH